MTTMTAKMARWKQRENVQSGFIFAGNLTNAVSKDLHARKLFPYFIPFSSMEYFINIQMY